MNASRSPHAEYVVSIVAGSLALLTLAVYFPVLSSDFVAMDDGLYVTENRHVMAGLTGEGFVWAFSNVEAGLWHPLTWLSHMLDCQLYGVNPVGHHFTSLALHIANTVLLFLVLRFMTGITWPPAVAAALFALHPLRVESVAWVAERKDVLSVFFGFLTLLAYVRYTAHPSVRHYLHVTLLFALGLMAKPMLVTLPGVLLLLDYWPLRRFALLEKIPLIVMAGMCAVATLFSAQSTSSLIGLGALPLGARLANAAVSYASYLAKAVWPTGLAVFYPLEPSLPPYRVAASTALVLAMSGLAVVGRRRCPYILVGWLWFVGTLLPVSGLLQAGSQAMADRFTYLPLTGLFIAVAWGAADASRRAGIPSSAVVGITSILFAVLAALTMHNLAYWRDGEHLFTHALEVTGNNWMAQDSLGVALLKKGNVRAAKGHFEEALRLYPEGYAHGEYDLGVTLALQGRFADAEAHFREAIRLQPNYADAEFNLGNALARQGKGAEAIVYLRQAVRDDPGSAAANAGLGTVLLNLGRFEEAVAPLSEAVRVKPEFAVAHYNLARALELQGKSSTASDHYARAFQLDPALRVQAERRQDP
jgi:tetratricopeptide (TPR) repeat protein